MKTTCQLFLTLIPFMFHKTLTVNKNGVHFNPLSYMWPFFPMEVFITQILMYYSDRNTSTTEFIKWAFIIYSCSSSVGSARDTKKRGLPARIHSWGAKKHKLQQGSVISITGKSMGYRGSTNINYIFIENRWVGRWFHGWLGKNWMDREMEVCKHDYWIETDT